MLRLSILVLTLLNISCAHLNSPLPSKPNSAISEISRVRKASIEARKDRSINAQKANSQRIRKTK